jgi:hypothetical protein
VTLRRTRKHHFNAKKPRTSRLCENNANESLTCSSPSGLLINRGQMECQNPITHPQELLTVDGLAGPVLPGGAWSCSAIRSSGADQPSRVVVGTF